MDRNIGFALLMESMFSEEQRPYLYVLGILAHFSYGLWQFGQYRDYRANADHG